MIYKKARYKKLVSLPGVQTIAIRVRRDTTTQESKPTAEHFKTELFDVEKGNLNCILFRASGIYEFMSARRIASVDTELEARTG